MATEERFQLRAPNAVWATIISHPNGKRELALDPKLTKLQVDSYLGGLVPYDSNGQLLTLQQHSSYVLALNDPSGLTCLTLQTDRDGHISEIQHEDVTLGITLQGGGSTQNDRIIPGHLLFKLHWKSSAP